MARRSVPSAPAVETVPVPTALRWHAWYPALFVLHGDQRKILRNCKVFAADTGLYVYRTDPADLRQVDAATPDWYSAIDYDKTAKPADDQTARNTGIRIHTAAGQVTITPRAGCSCAGQTLKGWFPEWAHVMHEWKP